MFSVKPPLALPPSADRAETLAHLRALIRDRAPSALCTIGQTPKPREHLPTGHPSLDDAVEGWPHPGLAEITGRQGTGRLRLIRPAVVALTCAHRPVAILDPLGQLNPPGWADIDPAHVMWVRCSPEQSGWAGEQLARSGAVPLVVLVDSPRQSRVGARLSRAAEQGRATVLVVSERTDMRLPAALRLQVQGQGLAGLTVTVEHLRGALPRHRALRLPHR